MGACVLALADAQEHVAKYPSRADDTGTDIRTAQHLLTRTLNGLNCKMEISDTQAASALLGFPTEVTSDVFVVYYGTGSFVYATTSSFRNDKESSDNVVGPCNEESKDDYCALKCDGEFSDHNIDQDYDRGASEPSGFDQVDVAGLLSVSLSSSMGASVPDEDGFADLMTHHCLSGSSEGYDSSSRSVHYEPLNSPLEDTRVPDEVTKSTRFGNGQLYRLGDKDSSEVVAVVQAQLYAYRGEELRTLSRVEYFATIGIRRAKSCGDSAASSSGGGDDNVSSSFSTKSAEFPFGEGCPLKPFYIQYIFRKQKTIVHADSLPPHPGPEPDISTSKHESWKKKANKFAEYYLTAYRPEVDVYDDQSYHRYKDRSSLYGSAYDYSWDTLMTFVRDLKSSSSAVDLMRLESMRACVTALKSRYSNREIMRDFRARARDLWSDREARAASSFSPTNKMSFNPELDEMVSGMEVKALLDRQIIEACQHIAYCDGQLDALKILLSCPSGRQHQRLEFGMDVHSAQLELIASQISAYNPDPPVLVVKSDSKFRDEESFLSDMQAKASEFYADGIGRSLNEDQLYIVRMYQTYFCRLKWYRLRKGHRHLRSVQPPDAPVQLLTGGPGTGKSHVITAVTELASHLNAGHVAKCAYMGVAACNIDGSTCSKTFVISFQNKKQEERINNAEQVKNLSFSQIEQLRMVLRGDELVLLVIDEISTVTPSILQIISCRMQQLYNNNLPFGGAAVLMVGGES